MLLLVHASSNHYNSCNSLTTTAFKSTAPARKLMCVIMFSTLPSLINYRKVDHKFRLFSLSYARCEPCERRKEMKKRTGATKTRLTFKRSRATIRGGGKLTFIYSLCSLSIPISWAALRNHFGFHSSSFRSPVFARFWNSTNESER